MLAQIILFDGFDLLDAMAPYEVLGAGGQAAGGALQVEFASFEGAREVRSGINGLKIPAIAAPDPRRADFMIVPGAAGPVSGDGPDSIRAMLGLPRLRGQSLPSLPLLAAGALGVVEPLRKMASTALPRATPTKLEAPAHHLPAPVCAHSEFEEGVGLDPQCSSCASTAVVSSWMGCLSPLMGACGRLHE